MRLRRRKNMQKHWLIGGAAAMALLAAPAAASPVYLNIEHNSGFTGIDGGADWVGGATEFHLGVEGGKGDVSGYIQAGPAWVTPSGIDGTVELSGKAGGAIALGSDVSLYGEISAASVNELDYVNTGAKVGLKISL
jgi:murein DD-endopeptidase MepM/ murein hydrolase activator NlpD